MNTSYKSLFPPAAPDPVESFAYPEGGAAGESHRHLEDNSTNDDITELLLKAHAEGVKEGEAKERARGVEQLLEEQNKINRAVEQFQAQVAAYYARTESEVVQLALAIAGKILEREAEVDRALVARLAKSVLDKLHGNTRVRVRVHPPDVENWRQYFSRNSDAKVNIEIVGDASVSADNCVLETGLGTTEAGVRAQFKELEAGLLDLIAENQGLA